MTQTNIITNKTVETVDHHQPSGGGLITAHNIVLNWLIITSITITLAALLDRTQFDDEVPSWRCELSGNLSAASPGLETDSNISLHIPTNILSS